MAPILLSNLARKQFRKKEINPDSGAVIFKCLLCNCNPQPESVATTIRWIDMIYTGRVGTVDVLVFASYPPASDALTDCPDLLIARCSLLIDLLFVFVLVIHSLTDIISSLLPCYTTGALSPRLILTSSISHQSPCQCQTTCSFPLSLTPLTLLQSNCLQLRFNRLSLKELWQELRSTFLRSPVPPKGELLFPSFLDPCIWYISNRQHVQKAILFTRAARW